MITLADAAEDLERICDTIANADEITEDMLNLFQKSKEEVEKEVDRAFRYKHYAESQAEYAKKVANEWYERSEKMLAIVDKIKASALATAKSSSVPLESPNGKIKIRKNSVPSLKYNTELLPKDYLMVVSQEFVDTVKIKQALLAGEKVEGATLEWGEHVRFTI